MDTRSSARDKSDLLAAFTELLDEKIDPIKKTLEKLNAIETGIDYALEELKKVPILQTQIENLEKEVEITKNELLESQIDNKNLKEALLKQELYSRKSNVKIVGFKDIKPEELEQAVVNVLNSVGVLLQPKDVERVHYVGLKKKKQARPILLRVNNFKAKLAIMGKKSKLQEQGIRVMDDYPDAILQRRKVIVPIFHKALKVCPDLKPKLLTDKMLLGGKIYNIESIDTVPVTELQPKYVFTPMEKGITAFFGKSSPLSNHYNTTLEFEGNTFNSSEQCFMFQKAAHFKDEVTAQQILHCKTPQQAKQLGKCVSNFDKKKRLSVAEDCMFKAVFNKFSQNTVIADFLQKTGNTDIVEANPLDTFWGAGIPLQDKNIFVKEMWKGKNRAGVVLSRVRECLKK